MKETGVQHLPGSGGFKQEFPSRHPEPTIEQLKSEIAVRDAEIERLKSAYGNLYRKAVGLNDVLGAAHNVYVAIQDMHLHLQEKPDPSAQKPEETGVSNSHATVCL